MEAKSLPRQLIALTINLRAGLRLASNQQLTPNNFIYSIDQLLWLFALIFSLEISVTYLAVDKPVTFSAYGLNHLGAVYLFDLLILLAISRLVHANTSDTGKLILAYLSSMPIFIIVFQTLSMPTHLYYDHPQSGGLLLLLLLAWHLYIILRLMRIVLSLSLGKSFYLATTAFLLSLSSSVFLPYSQLWYSDEPPQSDSLYEKLYKLSIEDLFYDQYPMVDKTLNGLTSQRPGITDLYLVTVAGYGLENVFLNEVEYVRELFDRRFDTSGRSMSLVNNIDTLSRYPLANRHNLSDSLSVIGEIMDTEEDILFLFMTSHGSKDPKFSVNFGPVPLDDITPLQLRQALDQAGILWRVIVVSSCYSGGFIEPLRTPNTLIITAAEKDRQSFGCGVKSEFTDFGTAYFKHALDKEPDFIEAFDIAAKWIKQKELREQRKHSLPQRFVGDEIRDKLSQLGEMRYSESTTYRQTYR
ncbi:MAG: C13 family peptidase [Candidatus Thiodiazotropha lotti]|nr:C13 family peptidase [Candidatus Thiodiazotropha lotti]MCG8000817.1 C13 family peptidase [Candidatus Thiodiazotropha lotti]MCW4185394.1 C13 family peptidase [Candidatus Thiodiazotropha weberae]MCW4192590.1 C13 family peptidase [Candidatus Thiodiazotropha weberae]